MADVKRTVTRTQDSGVNEQGARVQQRSDQIQTETQVDKKTTLQNVIWYILGIIIVLLATRLILKLLGANSTNDFVEFIYTITNIFTAPFDGIFGVSEATSGPTQAVFEPSIVVAGLVYSLITWGIIRLTTINQKV